MNLCIYKYNNYYNRKFKKEDFLLNYGEPIHVIENCRDFSPGDGVNTSHIFGSPQTNYDGSGDYILITEDDNNIISRWFILETNFTRNGQWNIIMRRDLIADYYNEILDAPMFIEKATLTANNPLIFNKENITVNQIKTSEILLKDETGCAWIVGYYDPNSEGNTVLDVTIQDEQPYDIAIPYTFKEWTGKDKTSFISKATDIYYRAKVNYSLPDYDNAEGFIYQFALNESYSGRTSTGMGNNGGGISIYTILLENVLSASSFRNYMNGTDGQLLSEANDSVNAIIRSSVDTLAIYKNKVLRFPSEDGKSYDYYKVTNSVITKSILNRSITKNDGQLYVELWDYGAANIPGATLTKNDKTFDFSCNYNETNYSFNKILTGTNVVKILSSVNKPVDAPYGVFCLPLPEEGKTFKLAYVKPDFSYETIEMSRQTCLNIAAALSRKYSGGNKIYDIQLLPYCPITLDQYIGDGYIYFEIAQAVPNSWSIITNENNASVGIMFHPQYTSFTKDIICNINVDNVKIENECNMYRLVSPNYNGQFEFNAAKNGGVSSINVDCTYLPYIPYIHLNPNFGLLYGKDFNDSRGLICGGDFSLPQMSDKWQTYQIQNKNFQATFDRGISNLEVQYNVQREQEIWQVISGGATGAIAGAMTGSAGGAMGAVAGAVVGAGLSTLGGIRDIQLNELLRSEALDYKKDLFGYQLDNIKALPSGIMKTTAYTYNNRIYPILEFYTCTEVEKRAVANKIAWNGMTVMAVGTLNEYIGASWAYLDIESKGYIKARLIRLDTIEDEYHLIKELSDELYKGVYF